jgi:hypothetical protein
MQAIIFQNGVLPLDIKKVTGNLHERINLRHRIVQTIQFLQEHPMTAGQAFEVDEDEQEEEDLECKWCGASVEHDTDFCSEKCKTDWIKE